MTINERTPLLASRAEDLNRNHEENNNSSDNGNENGGLNGSNNGYSNGVSTSQADGKTEKAPAGSNFGLWQVGALCGRHWNPKEHFKFGFFLGSDRSVRNSASFCRHLTGLGDSSNHSINL
jgi:hypothetical protein